MSRGLRVLLVSVGLVASAVLVACGPGEDQRLEAQEAADRVRPGLVTVLAVESGGITGVDTAVAALVGDDVAGLTWALRSGDCGPGSPCEEELIRAVDTARGDAEETRMLTSAFEGCGHPLVGLTALQRIGAETLGVAVPGEPIRATTATAVVAASLEGLGRAQLPARLDDCVAAYAAARAAMPDVDPSGPVVVEVLVVDPGPTPPPVDPQRPYSFVLSDGARALAEKVRHRTVVRADRDRLLLPAEQTLGPQRWENLAPAVEIAAAVFLRTRGETPQVGPNLLRPPSYLPGSVTRVRALAGFSDGEPGPGDRAVVVDVNLDGTAAVAVEIVEEPERLDLPD